MMNKVRETSTLNEASKHISVNLEWMSIKDEANGKRRHQLEIPYIIKYKHNESEITFIGAEHTFNPDNNMTREIKKAVLDYIKEVPVIAFPESNLTV